MEKMKLFIMSNRKAVIGGAVAAVLIICGAIGLYVTREQVTQKATDFDINVNTEVDTDITKYLDGVKNPEQVKVDWKTVDTTKIGNYDVTIKYKDNDYKVTFHVVDKEKPVIKLSKTEFEFTLDTSLEDVNKTINDSVKVTDNYDKKFEPVKAVTELPKETGEQTYNLSVKDTTGNESDKVQIKVNYTEPQEEEPQENQQYQSGGETGTTQGGYTPQAPVNNTPTPSPEPQAPVEQPSNNDYHVIVDVPSGALDGGLFNSNAEGSAWAHQYTDDPNSEWYNHMISCTTIETGQVRCYIKP